MPNIVSATRTNHVRCSIWHTSCSHSGATRNISLEKKDYSKGLPFLLESGIEEYLVELSSTGQESRGLKGIEGEMYGLARSVLSPLGYGNLEDMNVEFLIRSQPNNFPP